MNNHIHEFWETQANNFKDSHWASWGDKWAVGLEIKNIDKHIKEGDKVADIGCANGFSAVNHLHKSGVEILGVDFSEAMIREAKKQISNNRISFVVGDVRNLQLEDNSYDVVYTTRTLINLPTWCEQKMAIKECIRICKPGGKVVLSEAFWEPLVLLNSMRTLVGLKPLAEHDFNRYLKKECLEKFLTSIGVRRFYADNFSSVYYLGSRFLRELVTDYKKFPGYSNPVNELFYDIQNKYSGGDFGIQRAYSFRKGE